MVDERRGKKLRRFCAVAFWEGVSYVVLLGIAMPMKYFGNTPEPVTWVGWLHGLLFIAYLLFLYDVARACSWSLKRVALYFLASLLPIAPFVVERRLRREYGLRVRGDDGSPI